MHGFAVEIKHKSFDKILKITLLAGILYKATIYCFLSVSGL